MTDMEMALMANIAVDMQNKDVNDVLDKLRDEIIEKYWDCDICKWKDFHFNLIGDISDILQIIDKYKIEVEPQESEDKE